MAGPRPLGHVQRVAAPPVALDALAHQAGAQRVGACVAVVGVAQRVVVAVAVVGVQQAQAAVQVQLARALAVDGKLGAQQRVVGRRPAGR